MLKIFACLTLFTAPLAAAELGGVSTSIHHHYVSPRALGMGNAFVGLANDASALFYNPAGLARMEESSFDVSLSGGLSTQFLPFTKEISGAGKEEGASETDKQREILEIIEKSYGKTYGLRTAPISTIYTSEGFGWGFIPADVSLEMVINRTIGPTLNATVYGDTTLAMGWAKDVHWIPHSRLSLGITGKFVNRLYYSKSLNFIELAVNPDLFKKEDFSEGYTVDADLGMLWTPEIPSEGWFSWLRYARPSLGAVVRNAAELGFGQSFKTVQKEKGTAPEKLFRVIDVGSRWEIPTHWSLSGRALIDFKDFMHPAFNWRKATHVGVEIDWVLSALWKGSYRVGVNQGFATAGISAKVLFLEIDYATYGEDVGTYYSSKENRLHMARVNFSF